MAARVSLPLLDELAQLARPRTRADCADVPRPCPFVGCRHNNFLDVSKTGELVLTRPGLEAEDVPPEQSCSIDVAEREEGLNLEDLGAMSNVTRERIRQIQDKALERLQGKRGAILREVDEDDTWRRSPGKSITPASGARREPPEVDSVPDDEPPLRLSFFTNPGDERTDRHVADRVWAIFARDSNQRGFDCRTKGAKSVTAWRQKKAAEELAKMANKELTGRLSSILAAYKELSADGETPHVLKVADRAKVFGDTDRKRSANVYEALNVLRKRGLLPATARTGAAPPSQPTPPPSRPAARAVVVSKRSAVVVPTKAAAPAPVAPRAGATDAKGGALGALRDELATCERRAEALRQAMTILEGVGP